MNWHHDCLFTWSYALDTVRRRERLYEFAGSEYLINHYKQLDVWKHLVLEQDVGSSLDDKYSVIQWLAGDYTYFKWWDRGRTMWAWYKAKAKSGNIDWCLKALFWYFRLSVEYMIPSIAYTLVPLGQMAVRPSKTRRRLNRQLKNTRRVESTRTEP